MMNLRTDATYQAVIFRQVLTTLRMLPGMALIAAISLASTSTFAGEADVVGGSITALGDGRYRIDATIQHADTGWDHYANRWDVLAPDGSIIGVRELAHPHVNEQPFTRSLTLDIAAGISSVTLQANDSVHGLGGKTLELAVPAS